MENLPTNQLRFMNLMKIIRDKAFAVGHIVLPHRESIKNKMEIGRDISIGWLSIHSLLPFHSSFLEGIDKIVI